PAALACANSARSLGLLSSERVCSGARHRMRRKARTASGSRPNAASAVPSSSNARTCSGGGRPWVSASEARSRTASNRPSRSACSASARDTTPEPACSTIAERRISVDTARTLGVRCEGRQGDPLPRPLVRSRASMPAPIRFGRYLLLERLAVGGMAEIFLAKVVGEGGFERLCVVKRALPHLSRDPEFIRMFMDEARLAARLHHPGFVQIHELGTCDDDYYIAMEYLAGEDLAAVLVQSRKVGLPIP